MNQLNGSFLWHRQRYMHESIKSIAVFMAQTVGHMSQLTLSVSGTFYGTGTGTEVNPHNGSFGDLFVLLLVNY